MQPVEQNTQLGLECCHTRWWEAYLLNEMSRWLVGALLVALLPGVLLWGTGFWQRLGWLSGR